MKDRQGIKRMAVTAGARANPVSFIVKKYRLSHSCAIAFVNMILFTIA